MHMDWSAAPLGRTRRCDGRELPTKTHAVTAVDHDEPTLPIRILTRWIRHRTQEAVRNAEPRDDRSDVSAAAHESSHACGRWQPCGLPFTEIAISQPWCIPANERLNRRQSIVGVDHHGCSRRGKGGGREPSTCRLLLRVKAWTPELSACIQEQHSAVAADRDRLRPHSGHDDRWIRRHLNEPVIAVAADDGHSGKGSADLFNRALGTDGDGPQLVPTALGTGPCPVERSTPRAGRRP